MVSKDDLVDKFVAITGTDKETASHMLEACSNNLESAVSTFLDNGFSQNASTNGTNSADDDVRAPIPQTQGVLVEEFQPTPRWTSRRGRSVFEGFSSTFSDNAIKGDNKKLKKLEEMFRPPTDIIHQGTFQAARDEAVKENKWLMVNIQNVGEFSCQTLNRDVWSDKKVKSLIKDYFLFWQEPSDSREGDWFMTFYTVNEWPHVSILDPRTGGRLLTMSNITKANIVETINLFLADHGTHLDSDGSSGKSSKEDIFRLNEDEQLAAAIAASLRETQVEESNSTEKLFDSFICHPKEEKNSDSKTNCTEKQTSNHTSNSKPTFDSKSPKKKSLQKVFLKPRKRKLTNSSDLCNSFPKASKQTTGMDDDDNDFVLAPEYPTNNNGTKSSPAITKDFASSSKIRLLLKHPDGHREEVVLNACSKIKDLTTEISKNYDLNTYEVIKNFPRKVISSLHGELLLEEAGVYPKDTVFIQEKL